MGLLIGVNGFKNAGKDTIGELLIRHHGFKRLAFGDKVKETFGVLLDVDKSMADLLKNDPNCKILLYDSEVGDMYSEMTVREFLQRLGTQVGRNLFGEDFWVDQILPFKTIQTAKADNLFHGNRVVTDCRFINELARVKELDGYNIKVERPGCESDGHESEMEPPTYLIDFIIINDGTIEELQSKVENALVHFQILSER